MNQLTEIRFRKNLIYGLVFIFVLFLAVGLALNKQKMAVIAVSFAILPLFIYLAFFRFQILGLLTAMLIPLSVKMQLGPSVVSFPGEVLVLVVAAFYIIYSLNRKTFQLDSVWKHPLTLLILIDLAWSIFTGLMGELPLVSLKRLLIKSMFIIVFYFFFIDLFKQKKNIVRMWLFYGIGLIIPVGWTIFHHAQYDFSQVVSFVMPLPFFNDHTLYASCIAFILPIIFLFGIKPQWFGFHPKSRFLFLSLVLLLLLGEFFSFSRAAWLSIIIAGIAGVFIVFLRFKAIHFLLLVVIGVSLLTFYSQDIFQNIRKVSDVSRKEDVEEHFRSVMNIQTDDSNLERINRWQSALRMFKDRPIAGFGAGTYQFVYGRYQISTELTRISTNHGEKGNAHSEYLMVLSESGFVGLAIFLMLIYLLIAQAIQLFQTLSDKPLKWLTFAILLGLISYLVHGLFNSFIDTDKAAVLFYAAIATVVAIDIYHSKKSEKKSGFGNPNPGKKTDFST